MNDMYVFIWRRLENVSDSYHSDGGVVVFANSEKRARELANKQPGCVIPPDVPPDDVRGVFNEGDEVVYIFPDAGCC